MAKNEKRRDFNDISTDVLGNYVYALRDPRDKKVFYIGQATTHNRLFDHFGEADDYLNGDNILNMDDQNPSPKVFRIIEIWRSGNDVEFFILARRITENTNPLDSIESAAIDLLSISQNGPALNLVRGPNSSFLDENGIYDLAAPPINPADHNNTTVFIFQIQNQLIYNPDVYSATRAAWRVSNVNRNIGDAKAVGVSNYISRGSFTIDNWELHNGGPLYEFNGADYPPLQHMNWETIMQRARGFLMKGGGYLIVEFNGNGQYRFIRGNADHNTWFD